MAKYSVLLTFFICLLTAFFSSAKNSTEENNRLFDISLAELSKIKVSAASLRSQYTFEAPSKVHVITRKMITERNYRYLADAIKDFPAVRLSLYAASADSGSSEMIVRGIRGNNKIVLMWNGQRLNHPDSQPLHITPYLYPLKNIGKIEVLYGSASALYGSDTVSMTINMISSLADEIKDKWQVGIDYGSFSEKRGFLQYSGKIAEIKTEFLIDTYHTDGIDFSPFEQFYSRYPNEPGIAASFTHFPKALRDDYYHPSEQSTVARLRLELDNLSVQSYYQYFQTQTQIGWSPLTYEANDGSGQYIFKQWGVNLDHKFELRDGIWLQSIVDHSRSKLDPKSHWNRPNMVPFRVYSADLPPRGVGTKTYKLNFANKVKIEERLSWDAMNNKLHSVVGISYSLIDLMPKSANLDFPGSYNNSSSIADSAIQKFHNLTEKNIGLFIQSQYEYSKTITYTLGGRFDKHNRYGTTFNPRFALNYFSEKNGWFAKAIIGTSYLAPAAFFTFDTFLIPRDSQQIPNPDLLPEETTSMELNFGKRFGKFSIESSIFHSKVDNLIIQRQVKSIENKTDNLGDYTFTTFHTTNAGETSISGITIEIKALLYNNIEPYASVTYNTGETQDTTNKGTSYDLIHTPDYQVKFGFDSYWLNQSLILYLKTQYIGKAKYHPDNYRFPAKDQNGRQFTMNAYWLLDLGGTYKIKDNVNLHFNVNNVMAQEYDQPIVGQETSSWTRIASTPGLPRQFYLGLSMHF